MKHDHGNKHDYGHQWNRKAPEFFKDKYKKHGSANESSEHDEEDPEKAPEEE